MLKLLGGVKYICYFCLQVKYFENCVCKRIRINKILIFLMFRFLIFYGLSDVLCKNFMMLNMNKLLIFVMFLCGIVIIVLGSGFYFSKDFYSSSYMVVLDIILDIDECYGDFLMNLNFNLFDFNDFDVVEQSVEFDLVIGQYIIIEKIGDDFYCLFIFMFFDEYFDFC